jgi:hypothetical protein
MGKDQSKKEQPATEKERSMAEIRQRKCGRRPYQKPKPVVKACRPDPVMTTMAVGEEQSPAPPAGGIAKDAPLGDF